MSLACEEEVVPMLDGGTASPDAGARTDAASDDLGTAPDSGEAVPDVGPADTGFPDGGMPDAGPSDVGATDASPGLPPEIGSLGCILTGTQPGEIRCTWTVTDPEGGALGCEIDFGDGQTDRLDCAVGEITYRYGAATTRRYSISLTATDDAGLTATRMTSTPLLVPSNPMGLKVTVAEAPALPGGRLLYALTASNLSARPIMDAVVSVNVPMGLSFVWSSNAQPNASGCSVCAGGSTPTWSLGELAAGESRTILIDASVDDGLVNGASLVLNATLRATGQTPVGPLSSTVEVFDAPEASLTLSASRDPVFPGESFTYIVDAGNIGTRAVTGAEASLVLPAGVTAVAASGNGTIAGQRVSWTLGSFAVGLSLRRTVIVRVDANLASGEGLVARAELTHAGSLTTDNVAEHTLTVVEDPDQVMGAFGRPLAVELIPSLDPAAPGKRVQYALTVGNVSSRDVENVVVQIRTPDELRFVWSSNAEPNVDSGCSTCIAGGEAAWELDTLSAGETRTINIDTSVVAGVLSGALVALPVRVTATDLGDDIDRLKVIRVGDDPAAELTLAATEGLVRPGQTFRFLVDVGNVSESPLAMASVEVELPSGVTVDAASHGGTIAGQTATWSLGGVAVGASVRREVTVTADGTLEGGRLLRARAELTHSGDLEVDNVTFNAVRVAGADLPLSLAIRPSVDPVAPGGRVQYALTVGNISSRDLDDVWVQIRTPDELRFVWSSNAEPNVDSGCSTCNAGGEAAWGLGTIESGEARTINIDTTAVNGIEDGALVALPVRVWSSDLDHDLEQVEVIRVFTARSELTLTATKDPILPGESFEYYVDVGNVDNGSLAMASMKVELPPGLTLDSVSHGGSIVGQTASWSLGTFGVGASVRRTVSVTADGMLPAGTTLRARAEATHDGGLEVDHSALHTVTVADTQAPLVVDMAPSVDPAVPEGRIQFTLTVGNVSTRSVEDVFVQIRTPDELDFAWSTHAVPNVSSGCSTCRAGGEAGWAVGTLEGGETFTITIDARVSSATLEGALVALPLRVVASNLERDIERLEVVRVGSSSADLTLGVPTVSMAASDPVVAGDMLSYVVDVGNFGRSSLSNAALELTLPAGVTPGTASGMGTVSGRVATWTLGALAPGQTVQQSLPVTVGTMGVGAGEILRAEVRLIHGGGIEVDGRSVYPITVNTDRPPLGVVFAPSGPARVGGRILYTLEVINASTRRVTGVVALMRVPDGISFRSTNVLPAGLVSCSVCSPRVEASFALGDFDVGERKVVTIDAAVTGASGEVIDAPLRVTATELGDVIDLRRATPIGN